MSLPLAEVRRIAELARLQLSTDDEATFAVQLSEIVDYIDQLRTFDVGAPEVQDAEQAAADTVNDEPRLPDPEAEVLFEHFLDNAPASLDRFLLVPQVKATPGSSE